MKNNNKSSLVVEVMGIIFLALVAAVFFIWLFHQTSSNAERIVRDEMAVPGYMVMTPGYSVVAYGGAILLGLAIATCIFFRGNIAMHRERRWRRKAVRRTDEIIRTSGSYLPLFWQKK